MDHRRIEKGKRGVEGKEEKLKLVKPQKNAWPERS